MDELKEFDKSKYKKLDVSAVTVNGKESSNTVSAEEMMESQNIVMNITVKKSGDEDALVETEDVKKDESK
ncbi:hypothetical protein [Clostridium uliginosum]|uniref:Uncharacterized protein n=1 Tax=Clostridium uliginosum TaxID=119641 RepID=A0A1I1HG27_9CLOT|nr:hypothetical protein [Clostridium uliginosum]SFC22665.1 hypothetical protein SAMN05421842_101290 [Clostridium uliginosum]